jgi:hypothetical protein
LWIGRACFGAWRDDLLRTLRDLRLDRVDVPPELLGLLAMRSRAARDVGLDLLNRLAQPGGTLGNLARDIVTHHVCLIVRGAPDRKSAPSHGPRASESHGGSSMPMAPERCLAVRNMGAADMAHDRLPAMASGIMVGDRRG